MSTCVECGAARVPGTSCAACAAPAVAADGHGLAPFGAIAYATDFDGHGDPRGFRLHSAPRHERWRGPPLELAMELTPQHDDGMFELVSTQAEYADAEIAVTGRFLEEPLGGTHASFGVSVRSSPTGDYVVRLTSDGRYSVGFHDREGWRDYLVPWTTHPAVIASVGARNRLRVAAVGGSLRVAVNGTLLTTLHDGRYASGKMHVLVAPHGNRIRLGLSALELRT